MKKVDFYQSHLNRVSRSFAFSISILEEPLREYVGLTYLLCRWIDTYEDSRWDSKQEQLQQLQALKMAFLSKDYEVLLQEAPDTMHLENEGELLLLRDAKVLLQDYYSLPPRIQKHVKKLVVLMIDGMSYYIEKNPKAKIKIHSLKQLNQYCLFVAGIVGECLTELTKDKNTQITKDERHNAFTFGLFLQKINILKDQAKDEKAGRHFMPCRRLVFKSVIQHVENSKNYIHQIPQTQRSYKIFCLSAFLLGLKTLEGLHPTKPESFKLSREASEKLFSDLLIYAECTNKLNQFVKDFLAKVPKDLLCEKINNTLPLQLYNEFERTSLVYA